MADDRARVEAPQPGGASELSAVDDLDAAWRVRGEGPRLRAVRAAAERLRERFAAGPRALAVRTLDVTTFALPAKLAFCGAALSPAPLVVLTRRAVYVQFLRSGDIRSLLFDPTDPTGWRRAPYYARSIDEIGDYLTFNVLVREARPVEEQLAGLGVAPETIDYAAFDHLHAQDLRPVLGTRHGEVPARFPRARLLAPGAEWHDWDDPHPAERAWYVPDGRAGIDPGRIVLTDGDLALGDGVLLVRTPGHTSGSQTLFVNTSDGVWGFSGNGVCADSWSPLESRIRGLARTCRRLDLSVLPPVSPAEHGTLHHTSMIVERTLAGRLRRAPGFCQLFPSCEVTPSRIAPGLDPSVVHGQLSYGAIARGG